MSQLPNQHYPHNRPYVQPTQNSSSSSPRPSRHPLPHNNSSHSPSALSASALAERVQDLEEQLILLANTLNEEGRQNQSWQQQLTQQNRQIKAELDQREEEVAQLQEKLRYSEEQVKLLKDNLFKQNEDMETLHRELQQSRLHVSKIERANGAQLQEKVLELNDEISTLLVKIQQLIEENNQQTTYIEDLERAIKEFKNTHEASQAEIQRLTDENHYLKEEIKEVENLSMSQQKGVQDKLLEELEETKEQLQRALAAKEEQTRPSSTHMAKDSPVSEEREKELASLRSEVHSLEEEIMQQREIQRSLRKKYEQRLRQAEQEASCLSQQLLKFKHKHRQLENECVDHKFALQQLQKERFRQSCSRDATREVDRLKSTISTLEQEKQQMKLQIMKYQTYQRQQNSNDYYVDAINQAQTKINILKEQLSFAEDELSKSKRSSKEAAELAKNWEQDYRRLSQEYEQVLRSRSNFQEQMRRDQLDLARHKEVYEQLVRKYDHFEGMYRQLQTQVRLLQENKRNPGNYDRSISQGAMLQRSALRNQNSALIQENSGLREQISELKNRVEELSYQILERERKSDSGLVNKLQRCRSQVQRQKGEVQRLRSELQRYRIRQKQLEAIVENMKLRLSNSMESIDPSKFRELNDQLLRVNRMLNQKEMQLDSMKEKYQDLHVQLQKRDLNTSLPKHHPELTRLKSELVAIQRKLMENQIAAKNAIQNSEYQIQALKIQNSHHRKKIDQLLKELTNQRTSTDYRNLLHSLELAESRNRELERQVQHCQLKIKDLHEQLRRSRSRSRRGSDFKPSHSEEQARPSSITPRGHSTRIVQTQKSSEINKLKEDRQFRFDSEVEKQNAFGSVYEQLIKERMQLKLARNEFENKWGSLSTGSNRLQSNETANKIREKGGS